MGGLTSTRSLVVSASVAAFLVVACGVSVDIANKPCPCGDGYVCDTSTNLCVTPAALAASKRPVTCDPCTCTTSADCVDSSRSACVDKVCVECDPANDTCPAGSYCNAKSQCIVGCRASADCASISPQSPICATDRHQCVQCSGTTGCAAGETCSPSGSCAKGCTNAGGSCPGGGMCCGGLCVDTTSDPLNCGACGTACPDDNGSALCAASACSFSCANGFAKCGADTSCTTSTRDDVHNCGGCGIDCNSLVKNANGIACASGKCDYSRCNQGFVDANNDPTDGCEAPCGQPSQACCGGRHCNNDNQCTGPGTGTCKNQNE